MKHYTNKILLALPALLLICLLALLYSASPLYSGGWFDQEAAGHVGLYLEDSGILTSDKEAVRIQGSTATIVAPGEYKLSGSLTDGQIIVAAGPEDQVELKLDNVSIHCEHSAPIWVQSADRVKIKLPEDSVNFLSDGEFYDCPDPEASVPSACIFSSSDLTIKGKGELTVTAAYRNGISSSDSLYIKSGVLTVTAPNVALRGKDDVTVEGGLLTLTSGDTAVKTNGFVDVQGGQFNITTGGSAFHAVTGVTVAESSQVQAECGLTPVRCLGPVELAYPLTESEG